MLVINGIGPTKVKSVRLATDEVVVRMVDGTELLYRRTRNESGEALQIRRGSQTSKL